MTRKFPGFARYISAYQVFYLSVSRTRVDKVWDLDCPSHVSIVLVSLVEFY